MRTKTPRVATPDGAHVSNWRGLVHYHCDQCVYDTLERQKMVDHLSAWHGSLEYHADAVAVIEAIEPEPIETPVEE